MNESMNKHKCKNCGWTNEWIDEWMDGWTKEWINGWKKVLCKNDKTLEFD